MYMTGNNAFYTHSDGGYINVSVTNITNAIVLGIVLLTKRKLSYTHNRRCTFDRRTGDLTCA